MKKLISVLVALCLLCAAVAALAEAETVSFDDMPKIVTAEDGVELTDADFEGDWVVDKIFYKQDYVTPEQAAELGLLLQPIRIADGKIIIVVTDEEGDHETSTDLVLDANQLHFTDGQGIESVIEKLVDGNIVVSVFLPGEGDVMNSVSFFMVHPVTE